MTDVVPRPIRCRHRLEFCFVGVHHYPASGSLTSLKSRITYINSNGFCIIGMKKKAMIPLIGFDVLVNVCRPLRRQLRPSRR